MSTPFPFNFPVTIGPAGAQPTPPATILSQLLADVASTNPDYTANLPGTLIEDISSTDVAAISLIDQARVDLINSLTPAGANIPLLLALGAALGVIYGQPNNTSVFVVFSGTVGYIVPNGFLVSDGTYTYAVQGGGIIQTNGHSAPINCIAVQSGTWGVAANTVINLQTSLPLNIALTVTNPNPGTPGAGTENYDDYRARVLQANLAACIGTSRCIKTQLGNVPGVSSNSISVQQVTGAGIRVCASGGDPYATAYAIFTAISDPNVLRQSAINSNRNVTVAIIDGTDTYSVVYVNTPVQTVTLTITWNTIAANFTGGSAIPGLVAPPLVAYLNSLAAGQVINILAMDAIFQEAIAGLLDLSLLTRLVFAVYINGSLVNPGSGEAYVAGDPESNFFAQTTGITVNQG